MSRPSRTRAAWVFCAMLSLGFGTHTSAQVAMHREVPRGEVTGLEMGIEGSLVATPGAALALVGHPLRGRPSS